MLFCSRMHPPPDNFPTSGPTVAEPSGDHIPLGGFVLRLSDAISEEIPDKDGLGRDNIAAALL
jgi:hypothetical protein